MPLLWFGICVLGVGTAYAESPGPPKPSSSHGQRMEWEAAVGPGLLHQHMETMIRQMSGMVSLMGKMAATGTMGSGTMRRMAEAMSEIADMLGEMPAVDRLAAKRPDLAMRDMDTMMARLNALDRRMQGLMPVELR